MDKDKNMINIAIPILTALIGFFGGTMATMRIETTHNQYTDVKQSQENKQSQVQSTTTIVMDKVKNKQEWGMTNFSTQEELSIFYYENNLDPIISDIYVWNDNGTNKIYLYYIKPFNPDTNFISSSTSNFVTNITNSSKEVKLGLFGKTLF